MSNRHVIMNTTTRRSRIAWAAVLLLTPMVAQGADAVPVPAASFSFVPNQLAGSEWYKPGNPPRLINGHLDDSFGQKKLWPNLVKNLKQTHGAFGIYAAEIGHLSATNGLLSLLKSEGISVSVEVPGFTQPIDGAALGRAEIHGEAVDGTNLFASVFRICEPKDRTDPLGSGWFVTRGGAPFVPDELIFDERMPNLLPEFDPTRLALTQGSWDQRKQAARRLSPFMASRQPYERLTATLMQDYVSYLRVARNRWGERMPAVSLHWNVNPGWEWRDEKGLDAIHAKNPALFNIPENFHRIVFTSPQYNSVQYLNQLVDLLASSGFKPRTVYVDVDWTYDISYIVEVLKRHKAALRQRGVQMGINVVEASIGEQEELFYDADTLKKRTDSRTAPNILYENTLIAIMRFLKGRGIYERGMHIRVGSWSHRPHEVGSQVDEHTPGSLAHTANEILKLL
jgi:hypothetical protein